DRHGVVPGGWHARRTGPIRSRHPGEEPARSIAAVLDRTLRLVLRLSVAGDRRDLDGIAEIVECPTDAQGPGVWRGGVAHEDNGSFARRGAGAHHRRPVSRLYSSRSRV